jgi:nucleoid-associated protein YgaU
MQALKLGDFVFERDDLPESIPLGGEQTLAVFQYPGGPKEVQVFGAHDSNPSWNGTFNYTNAIAKVRVLDKMYRSGSVYTLQIGSLSPRYGVIKKFDWVYKSPVEIDYTIELELAPQTSLLASQNVSSGGASKTTTSAATTPQKTYTVVSGDSLWSIAQKFYGDGSQYKKIATANNIKNVDSITVGASLIIP